MYRQGRVSLACYTKVTQEKLDTIMVRKSPCYHLTMKTAPRKQCSSIKINPINQWYNDICCKKRSWSELPSNSAFPIPMMIIDIAREEACTTTKQATLCIKQTIYNTLYHPSEIFARCYLNDIWPVLWLPLSFTFSSVMGNLC